MHFNLKYLEQNDATKSHRFIFDIDQILINLSDMSISFTLVSLNNWIKKYILAQNAYRESTMANTGKKNLIQFQSESMINNLTKITNNKVINYSGMDLVFKYANNEYKIKPREEIALDYKNIWNVKQYGPKQVTLLYDKNTKINIPIEKIITLNHIIDKNKNFFLVSDNILSKDRQMNITIYSPIIFKTQTKYKDNQFEISFLNCTLQKINITSVKSELKYYNIPPNILKCIFSIKDENKIFNTNCSNISLISKCIGENSKLILSSKEADIIQEEQAFIKKAKIKDELYEVEKNEPPPPRHPNGFNRLKTIELLQNNSNMKLESKKDEDIKDKNNLKIKEKREKLGKKSDNNVIKYLNQKDLEFNKNYSKKVSIHNLNHLRKSRIEHGTRKDSKKITLKKNSEDKK